MKIIIMCGVPGSGKSRFANSIEGTKKICSADLYFTNHYGEYHFDGSKLSAAHKWCYETFVYECSQWYLPDYIIVDNTNLKLEHILPYHTFATSMGFDVLIVKISRDVSKCIEQNVHSVPEKSIRKMHQLFVNLEFPNEWTVYNIHILQDSYKHYSENIEWIFEKGTF